MVEGIAISKILLINFEKFWLRAPTTTIISLGVLTNVTLKLYRICFHRESNQVFHGRSLRYRWAKLWGCDNGSKVKQRITGEHKYYFFFTKYQPILVSHGKKCTFCVQFTIYNIFCTFLARILNTYWKCKKRLASSTF